MQTLTDKFKLQPQTAPPLPIIQHENKYIDLLTKIQERAMKAACDYYPKVVHDMFGEVLIDPYIKYHPSDSDLWIKLFLNCNNDCDLYGRLFYIRGGGTILTQDYRWGYKMQPIIGQDGWESRNQYLIESACLNNYKDTVIKMLRELEA